jgi:hypothetical protein
MKRHTAGHYRSELTANVCSIREVTLPVVVQSY